MRIGMEKVYLCRRVPRRCVCNSVGRIAGWRNPQARMRIKRSVAVIPGCRRFESFQAHKHCGVEKWYLVGLITQRPRVQVPLPLLYRLRGFL